MKPSCRVSPGDFTLAGATHCGGGRRGLRWSPVPVMPLLGRCLLLCTAAVAAVANAQLPPTCDSLVYCQGELLHTVQMAGLFDDSKTFVDMKQKQPPNETLSNFEQFLAEHGDNYTAADLLEFVQDNFESETDLLEWEPPDWQEEPAVLDRIADDDLREWASFLNSEWLQLARRVSDDVKDNADLYSLIYVPNGFIVPGGRFREYYYWDSYWIIKGLLVTDMPETVRGMLSNFLSIVSSLGHMPNGGRVYYQQRSQPPLLTPMVGLLVDYCASHGCDYLAFLKQNLATLDTEYQFWVKNHSVEVTVRGTTHTLFRYFAPSLGPRPESYREDYEAAESLPDDQSKQDLYTDFKSAAETGWDFSSRWFISNATNKGNLTNTKTRYIIPVDLNAFMYLNARLLADFHSLVGSIVKARYYNRQMKQILEGIEGVLWNEAEGVWFDYDNLNGVSRNYFYPSNLAPLWTESYDKKKVDPMRIISYLKENNIQSYTGGTPASLTSTGEQWDFPNAWPPLQAILIQGLMKTGHAVTTEYAYRLLHNWINANYLGYNNTGEMFEKYDARLPGQFGGGGEYVVQPGFGWTNGVILELLSEFGQNLTGKSPLYMNTYHHLKQHWSNRKWTRKNHSNIFI